MFNLPLPLALIVNHIYTILIIITGDGGGGGEWSGSLNYLLICTGYILCMVICNF